MMKSNTGRIFYALSWGINLLLPFLVFGVFEDVFYRIYYNSDTLYLASVYKDIFVDGTGLKGWNLNGAPNFFPDMIIYFVIRPLTGDFKLAYVIFSAVQYNLLLFLLGSLFKGINSKVNRNYITMFNLLFSVFLLATILHGSFEYTFNIFSQSYHNGCFINSLIALNFLLRYLTRNKKSYFFAMLVFVFLGVFNDRLFMITFVAPVVALLILNLIWIRKRSITSSGLWITGVGIISLITFNATKRNAVYECIGLGEKFMQFSNAGPSLKNMVSQHTDFIASMDLRGLITVLTIVSFVTMVFLFFRIAKQTAWFKNPDKVDTISLLFILFSLSSVFLTLFTPVVNGYYLGPSCIRYTMLSFYLSLFNVVFIIWYLTNKIKAIKWQNLLLGGLTILYGAIIVNTIVKVPVKDNFKDVIHYYPEQVKAVDEFAQKDHLQFGVADYWDAKYTTMFSKKNVRVYTAINEKLNLWYHVMNSNWYYQHEKGKFKNPEFRFVIFSPDRFRTTRELFGEPLDSVQVAKSKFIYQIPEFKYNRETKQPYRVKQVKQKTNDD